MKFNTTERQPIGAYYYQVFKMLLALIIFWLIIIISQAPFPVGNVIFLFVFIVVPYAVYRKMRYNNYRYSVSEEKITLESGVLSKDTIAVPFNLIKNVNVSEPILLRTLGRLAKIKFSTSQPQDIEIILQKEDALSLQSIIASKMATNRLTMVDHKN